MNKQDLSESEMTMKVNHKIIVNAVMTGGLALAGLVGCNEDKSSMSDFFPKDDQNRHIRQLANAQAATGAKEDATLNAVHFDGSKLNSLGTNKLTLMLPNEGDDVTVYLNLPAGEATTQRHDAVVAYLKTAGVEETHIKIENGPNPGVSHPTASELTNLAKTDSSAAGGDASSGGDSFKSSSGSK
ncbi:MAG TPA: hypothetical protein VHD56_19915 [Tepidisphaeraceae bacterium]|nr:hypothetical protein [Tepidisphaeraceae bacterium]